MEDEGLLIKSQQLEIAKCDLKLRLKIWGQYVY